MMCRASTHRWEVSYWSMCQFCQRVMDTRWMGCTLRSCESTSMNSWRRECIKRDLWPKKDWYTRSSSWFLDASRCYLFSLFLHFWNEVQVKSHDARIYSEKVCHRRIVPRRWIPLQIFWSMNAMWHLVFESPVIAMLQSGSIGGLWTKSTYADDAYLFALSVEIDRFNRLVQIKGSTF